MSLQELPLDILLEIARSHPWVGCELSKTVRKVGFYSLENDMKRWFEVEENGNTFILIKSSKEPYYEKLRHSWDDAPAVIYSDGTQWWYKKGMIHRDNDLPATIFPDGTKHWFKEGKQHRDDKPAIIEARGTKVWFKQGMLHRDGDKPALRAPDGTQEWYKDGKQIFL